MGKWIYCYAGSSFRNGTVGGEGAGHNPSVALSVVSHTDEGKECVWVPKPCQEFDLSFLRHTACSTVTTPVELPRLEGRIQNSTKRNTLHVGVII